MEWKDFEPVLRDVWVGSIPKWRAKHLNVTELSEISVDFGTMTEGDIVFGAPAAAHIVMSSTEESFATYDDYGRPIWRSGSAEPRFQVGLTWNPGIRYEDGAVVTDGETIRLNSITYDKLLLATRQYNYLKEGELIQGDASVYQTTELHDLGLDMMAVTNQPPMSADDVLDGPGIKFQAVAWFEDEGYSYYNSGLTKFAFTQSIATFWKYSNNYLQFGNLNDLRIEAWYGVDGFYLTPSDNNVFSLGIFQDSSSFQAWINYIDPETDGGYTQLLWESLAFSIAHAHNEPSFVTTKDGVTIRDYLAFHSTSTDPVDPPIGSLVYDRTNDYYKFRNSAGVYRRLSDEAI